MNGFWKPFRVVLSLVLFLLICFVFIDFRQVLPTSWYRIITYLQFIPSARKFIILAGIMSAGFLIVSIITILIGRVYCSFICPLGTLQDIIIYFSNKFRSKNHRYKFAKPKNAIRYFLLAISIIPLFFSSITVIYLLDPYSNFGRIASDIGIPVFHAINNLFASFLIHLHIFFLSPFDLPSLSWRILFFPSAFLVVIIVFSVGNGRLYCNTICPVGTMLGLLSRFSIFKMVVDKGTCTKCAKCATVCKSQCISVKEQNIDFSRCVGCLNCIGVCDSGSIGFHPRYSKPIVSKEFKKSDPSKRQFLLSGMILTGAFLIRPDRLFAVNKNHAVYLKTIHRKNVATPPGSRNLTHFNTSCTGCHLCVSVCPGKVLQPSLLQYGIGGILQPFMDFHSGYCQYGCTKCGEVCPTGAILKLLPEEKKLTQIGTVQFVRENCIVYNKETSCGSCAEHCPTQAVSMVPYKGMLTIPQVNDSICIGCGACEYACPVRPYRAIYVEGNPIHKKAKKPISKKVKDTSKDDFPF